jgi:uncharacterized protein with HEPN domain
MKDVPIRAYVLDMLEYIGYAEQTIGDTGPSIIQRNITARLAVERAYEVLGEIVKRLPKDLLADHPNPVWQKLKGFRDVISHQYNNVDLLLMMEALKDLPNLRAAVEALLATLPEEADPPQDNESA